MSKKEKKREGNKCNTLQEEDKNSNYIIINIFRKIRLYIWSKYRLLIKNTGIRNNFWFGKTNTIM